MLQRILSGIWSMVANPKVRLPVSFPWSTGKMAKTYGVALLWYIAGSFIPVIAAMAGLMFLARTNPDSVAPYVEGNGWLTFAVALSVISFVTGFGAEVLYLRRAMHKDGLSLRKTLAINLDSLNGSLWAAFWRALVAFGLVNLANLLIGLVFNPVVHDPAADFARQVTGGNFFALAVLMVVIAPPIEELVFRGFLYSMLRKSFRGEKVSRWLRSDGMADLAAALVSGACFAAAHMNPSGFLLYMAMGAISAELYRRSGSLIPSIMLHALNNLVGVIVLLLASGVH